VGIIGVKENNFMNLAVAKLVLCVVDIQRPKQLFYSFPAVHISVLWDGQRVQDTVAGKSWWFS